VFGFNSVYWEHRIYWLFAKSPDMGKTREKKKNKRPPRPDRSHCLPRAGGDICVTRATSWDGGWACRAARVDAVWARGPNSSDLTRAATSPVPSGRTQTPPLGPSLPSEGAQPPARKRKGNRSDSRPQLRPERIDSVSKGEQGDLR